MAKKEPEIFLSLREAGRAKVRYGRANLTVERMVSVHLTPLQETLTAHRKGEVSAEEVAWAFIKEQVVSHTPSFNWDDTDLTKLLPRITAVAKEPKLKATTPAELIPELEAIEKQERERWTKVSKQIQKHIPTIPKLGLTVSKDLFKMHGALQKPLIPDSVLRNITMTNQGIATGLGANYGEMLRAIQPNLKTFENLRLDLGRFSKLVRPELQLAGLGIDPAAFENLAQLSSVVSQAAVKAQFETESWRELMRQVAEAASETDSPDIAKAAETTADEAQADSADFDATLLFDRFEDLSEQIKREAANDSMLRAVLLAVIANLIARYIEYQLAIKFGIHLNLSEQPTP